MTKWVLVKKHWMGSFADLTFAILFTIILFVFHHLFCYYFFVFKIYVEQDLSLVFFKQICVCATAFEDLKCTIELTFKEVINLVHRLRISTCFTSIVAFTEENLGCITFTLVDEKSIYIQFVVEKGGLTKRSSQVFFLAFTDKSCS